MQDLLMAVFESLYRYAPQILGAICLFLVGWWFSDWFGKKFTKFLKNTKVGLFLEKNGIETIFRAIDRDLDAPKFLGQLVRWSLFFLVLAGCFQILGWSYFVKIITGILSYLPNIWVAVLIFLFSAFIVDFSSKIVLGSFLDKEIVYSRFLGKTFSSVIWTLAFLAILYQLKIVPQLILIIFAGIVGVMVLIFGISFGLAGKDLAQKILKELEKKLK